MDALICFFCIGSALMITLAIYTVERGAAKTKAWFRSEIEKRTKRLEQIRVDNGSDLDYIIAMAELRTLKDCAKHMGYDE
jgi:hypothetical protein